MILGALAVLPVFLLDWYAVKRSLARAKYITKPLALLVLMAWFAAANFTSAHSSTIWSLLLLFFAGLVLSLAGDVFLLLPGRFFLLGLLAFLAAHICYIASLTIWKAQPAPLLAGAAVLVLAGSTRYFLALNREIMRSSRARRMSAAVGVYVAAISLMLVSAFSTNFQPGWHALPAIVISAGGLLFFLSDELLAYDKFICPVSQGRLKVRILYHLGQLCLAGGFTLQAASGAW